jgi:LPS export ABC transporter permease LptF
MVILRRYMLKEWFGAFLASLGIFTLILSIGNLTKLVDLIISKGVESYFVLKLFLFILPFSLVYTVPIASLISTLLTFGRFSADNEIIAIRTAGISLKKVSIPFLILGIILSLISFILNNKVLPYTHYASREIVFKIGRQNPTAYLEPGTFVKAFKNHILFFYSMKHNELKNVRIYVTEKDKPLRTIIAQRAKIKGVKNRNALELILYNGTTDELAKSKPNRLYKLNFKVYSLTLNLAGSSKKKLDKKTVELTIKGLKKTAKILGKKNIDTLEIYSEIYKRYAQSFSPFLFILIGLSLGVKTHRREKSVSYGLGLIIIVFYYTAMITTETLILNRDLPVTIGHWIPDIFILIPAVILFIKLDYLR